MDAKQLHKYVINPVLRYLEPEVPYSPAAAMLVLATACAESQCGKFIKQVGAGPALGIWQMEPATHDDIWQNFLVYRPKLAKKIEVMNIQLEFDNWLDIPSVSDPETGNNFQADANEMIGNLYYACAMCRVHYFRQKEPLPPAAHMQKIAEYWKRHYNTVKGAGTVEHFDESCMRAGVTGSAFLVEV